MPERDPLARLPKLSEEERASLHRPRTESTPEQRREAWKRLQKMADAGLFDFDRVVDLNKSVDDDLLRKAMHALGVETRTDAIHQALELAIEVGRKRPNGA